MNVSRLTPTVVVPLVLAACAAFVGWATPPAHAAGAVEIASFGEEGSGAGQLYGPRAIAVTEETHNVYVADTKNNRVEEFTASGAFVLMFGKEVNATRDTEVGATEEEKDVCTQIEIEAKGVTCQTGVAAEGNVDEAGFDDPEGIAVDNSGGPDEGDVYVSDSQDRANYRVEVFSSSGTWIKEFNGEATPTGSFEGPTGLTVDRTGDVYVVDRFHYVLDKFSPLGTTYIASPYLTELKKPIQAAVDSNTGYEAIYIRQRENDIAKFSYVTGASEGEVGTGSDTQDVAVNTVTNDVYVSETGQVSEYEPGGATLIEQFGSFPESSEATIAVDSSTGTVYVVLNESDKVEAFSSTAVLPEPITGSASPQKTTAKVEGEVNPNGAALTECRFEYGVTTAYGQQPPAPCLNPSAAEVGDGTSAVKVSAQLTGLTPNQTYHYRLVAANASASKKGEDGEFTTTTPPSVNDQPPSASGITRTTAELSGTVDPENSPTEYDFQYVRAAEYEPSAPDPYRTGAETPQASAGQGLVDVSVGPQIGVELQPETTYDYRLVATNAAAGTETGPDYTFTTAPRTPALVGTGQASAITQTRATISGTVDPQGIETSYTFEVGTDTTYSGGKDFGDAGDGDGAEPIAVSLEDLGPGTTYHYRLTATNADGTSYGQDMSFMTPGVPSPIGQPLTMPLLATPSSAFPAETGATTKTTTKGLTRAQKLAAALKTCRTKKKGKQAGCEKRARKEYAPAKTGQKKKHNKQH